MHLFLRSCLRPFSIYRNARNAPASANVLRRRCYLKSFCNWSLLLHPSQSDSSNPRKARKPLKLSLPRKAKQATHYFLIRPHPDVVFSHFSACNPSSFSLSFSLFVHASHSSCSLSICASNSHPLTLISPLFFDVLHPSNDAPARTSRATDASPVDIVGWYRTWSLHQTIKLHGVFSQTEGAASNCERAAPKQPRLRKS